MNEREILLYHSLKGLHLLDKAPKMRIVRDICGLQAQFSRNPQYSLWLRASDYHPDTWGDGLCKLWSHRGTMYVVPLDEAGVHLAALGTPAHFVEGAWGLTRREMEYWSAFLIDRIQSGTTSRDGLKSACLAHGMSEDLLDRVFYGWGGLIREMVLRGMILMKTGTQKEYFVPQNVPFWDQNEAKKALFERYFAHFGPASIDDFRHFFTHFRSAQDGPLLDSVLSGLCRTVIDGAAYYHAQPLTEDGPLPECVLVPGFDALISGYHDRSRMIDDAHKRKLVNMAGIVFPSVLLRGRLRARWKIEGDKVVVTPFEPLLKKDEAALRRSVRSRLSPAVRQVEFLPPC